MVNVKNYTEQGGERTVIGGELVIEAGGKLLLGDTELKQAENVADSTASTIATLKEDFNGLLSKLKAAGFIAPDAE